MFTHLLGYPRIGLHRELKRACEQYWAGKISQDELLRTGKMIRESNWQQQIAAGMDWLPCGDFSFYDHVLDMSLMLGVIPERFAPLKEKGVDGLDLYFAMARGYQRDGLDIPALEMTKWFNTNYHYLVPEFAPDQSFSLQPYSLLEALAEAQAFQRPVKPILIGPVSYLLLGKMSITHSNPLHLLPSLLPCYAELLRLLHRHGVQWVQLDEPFLATDLAADSLQAFRDAYSYLHGEIPEIHVLLATYFGGLGDYLPQVVQWPVQGVHLDLISDPEQLQPALQLLPPDKWLSMGIVDGRNVWKNDFTYSLSLIEQAVQKLGPERILLAPSCSLLHVPYDLQMETNSNGLPDAVKSWLAFARQKLEELTVLKQLAVAGTHRQALPRLIENQLAIEQKKIAAFAHLPEIQQRIARLQENDLHRLHAFPIRKAAQQQALQLPLLPTTTIGSFPQTTELRQLRARWNKGEISDKAYEQALEESIREVIALQEKIGLDVLVHGEFERSDMVEYFARQLTGFAFTEHGWVQSYGSRCVKPPILFGDVTRKQDMTVRWIRFAQSLTSRPVKGMLTGPVTLLQWSFVRNDMPREQIAYQLALAIRDEVKALEEAGIRVIQIDEPAFREGLPLRREQQPAYLQWAVRAFRLASCGVKDETQIHTHMCYSEFNSIMQHIADLDADVITIEASRSHMELLDAFGDFQYPNDIGPGIYDIHSPRIPSADEMVALLQKAARIIPVRQLWVNPDCGLKTRNWPEVKASLQNMVAAAQRVRNMYISSRQAVNP